VTNISGKGVWILLSERELFLPFEQFPWFRDAPIGGILKVKAPSANHLHWPDLDIDIAVDSILHPERYPLMSRVMPVKKALRRRAPGQKARTARRP
jgi:hypothetical protein